MGDLRTYEARQAFQIRWCSRCVHFDWDAITECPVLGLHDEWDDVQRGAGKRARRMRETLEAFIPVVEDQNDECTMFHEGVYQSPLQLVKHDMRREILGPQLAEELAAR